MCDRIDAPDLADCERAEAGTRTYDMLEDELRAQRSNAAEFALTAWDQRADMLGYFEAAELQRAYDEDGLDAVAAMIDDGGHFCIDGAACDGARVPGEPPLDGPTCPACVAAEDDAGALDEMRGAA